MPQAWVSFRLKDIMLRFWPWLRYIINDSVDLAEKYVSNALGYGRVNVNTGAGVSGYPLQAIMYAGGVGCLSLLLGRKDLFDSCEAWLLTQTPAALNVSDVAEAWAFTADAYTAVANNTLDPSNRTALLDKAKDIIDYILSHMGALGFPYNTYNLGAGTQSGATFVANRLCPAVSALRYYQMTGDAAYATAAKNIFQSAWANSTNAFITNCLDDQVDPDTGVSNIGIDPGGLADSLENLMIAYAITGDSWYLNTAIAMVDDARTYLWQDERGMFLRWRHDTNNYYTFYDTTKTVWALHLGGYLALEHRYGRNFPDYGAFFDGRERLTFISGLPPTVSYPYRSPVTGTLQFRSIEPEWINGCCIAYLSSGDRSYIEKISKYWLAAQVARYPYGYAWINLSDFSVASNEQTDWVFDALGSAIVAMMIADPDFVDPLEILKYYGGGWNYIFDAYKIRELAGWTA